MCRREEVSQQEVKKQILEEFGEISSVDNGSSAKDKFIGRKNYKKVYNDFAKGQIDVWYKDPLYGKINQFGMISVTEDKMGVWAGIGKISPFVLEAFNDFKEEFFKHQHSTNSKFLNEIEIVRGWEQPGIAQREYLDELYEGFKQDVLERKKKSEDIKDINDFYYFLKIYLKENGLPLSFPGFMESPVNNPFTSGLVLEVYDGDPTSDEEKTEFYEDLNFPGYKYWAKMHGLKVDPNIPWRLIADISSEKMLKYITNDKTFKDELEPPYTLKKIYDVLFTPVASSFTALERFDGLNKVINRFYQQFLEDNPQYHTKKIVVENGHRRVYIEKFNRDTTEITDIMNKYVEVRFLEREISADLGAIKKIANQIYNYALTQAGDQRKYFSHIAINFVEFAIGSVASVRQSVDKNSLTTVTTSPIFILDLVEDFKRYDAYENLISEFFSLPIKFDIVGALVDIPNTGQ